MILQIHASIWLSKKKKKKKKKKTADCDVGELNKPGSMLNGLLWIVIYLSFILCT